MGIQGRKESEDRVMVGYSANARMEGESRKALRDLGRAPQPQVLDFSQGQ